MSRMLFALCALALISVAVSVPTVTFQLTNATTASFLIQVNGADWLRSAPTFFRANRRMYMTNDSSLLLTSQSAHTGADAIGSYNAVSLHWSTSDGTASFATIIRLYSALIAQPQFTAQDNIRAITFEQRYITGVTGAATESSDHLISSFPSFSMLPSSISGVLQWAGPFVWVETSAVKWEPQAKLEYGIFSGPLTFFDAKGQVVSTLAPLTEPMSASVVKTGPSTVGYGLMGMIDAIPAQFSSTFILYFDDRGVTESVMSWGDVMLSRTGKVRSHAFDEVTSQYIGYNTDHGAYYYYYTEPGKTYEQTLIDVNTYAKSVDLPYKHMLLDSWWYYKGINNGVKNWTAMPTIFPNGLTYLQEKLQMPFIMHNRYWSPNADQAKSNGGQYEWIIEKDFSLPIDPNFWPDLFNNASTWGLQVYEQDWLYNEFQGMHAILSSPYLGRQWLMQMGNAAQAHGISLQYCMSLPRHLLQSIELPNVKQIRASDDYLPGNKGYQQWRIFDSSLFAFALGVLPFKDNLWTTGHQPGTPGNPTEPSPPMQSAVALLSTGPYTPSDGIGYTNMTLVRRSIRADGLLLKPDRPALSLDSSYVFRATGQNGPDGYVSTTYSRLSGQTWYIVMSIELMDNYKLTTDDLNINSDLEFVAYKYSGATANVDLSSLQSFSAGSPVLLQPTNQVTFEIYYFAPVLNNGMMLLGDVSRWAPMSRQRFGVVDVADDGTSIVINGAANEMITVTWAMKDGSAYSAVDTECTVPLSGSVKLTVNLDLTYSCSNQ